MEGLPTVLERAFTSSAWPYAADAFVCTLEQVRYPV
jgi:hypothetical protein